MKAKPIYGPDGMLHGYSIKCLGCGHNHVVYTNPQVYQESTWGFNGDVNNPTFTPSLLVRSGHFIPDFKAGERCWCTYNNEHLDSPKPFECTVCHSFITDGKIQYLNDCTHHLRGQTIELPELS
jgi:hypothetical protein